LELVKLDETRPAAGVERIKDSAYGSYVPVSYPLLAIVFIA
jgi:hypothetical protein